jgi:hypothetical protein
MSNLYPKPESMIYMLDPGLGPLASAKSCTSRRALFLKDRPSNTYKLENHSKVAVKILYLVIIPKIPDFQDFLVDNTNAGIEVAIRKVGAYREASPVLLGGR